MPRSNSSSAVGSIAHRTSAQPLRWLGALLAIYLCAPFLASVPQFRQADWHSVDWQATWSAVAISAGSASLAALLSLLGGVPLGYLLARSERRSMALLGFVVQLPLALPPLTSGILLLFLLGPYSWLGSLFSGHLTDSFAGIVLAETFVAAPFLIVAARSAFASVDPVYDDVAATLGHHAVSRFMRVTLPLAWGTIRAGLALCWLRGFGEFGATVMVAYHPYSLPVYTYVTFGGQGLPAMLPLLLPTLAVAILCTWVAVYRRDASSVMQVTPGALDRLGAPNAIPTEADAARAAHGETPATAGSALQLDAPAGSMGRHEPAHGARLQVRLSKRLGDFQLAISWSPVSRRLAILGPSGSGKSLALRLIAGVERGGQVDLKLGSRELGGLSPENRQIGYMPQDHGLFPHMRVERQLSFPVGADPVKARYWLTQLGLDGLGPRLPRELSFGQRQRVALVRALAMQSQLLLFDEPFSALDTPRRRALQHALRDLQRDVPAITVIVTHDPDEAALLADEILVMEQGTMLQAGPTQDLFARPASRRVAELLGLDNIGTGRMQAPGRIAPLQTRGPSLLSGQPTPPVGCAVMWRIASAAIQISGAIADQKETESGAYTVLDAIVADAELRRGERYLHLHGGGLRLVVANAEWCWQTGMRVCVSIAASGVTVWPAYNPGTS